jgi:hypothetical protein
MADCGLQFADCSAQAPGNRQSEIRNPQGLRISQLAGRTGGSSLTTEYGKGTTTSSQM